MVFSFNPRDLTKNALKVEAYTTFSTAMDPDFLIDAYLSASDDLSLQNDLKTHNAVSEFLYSTGPIPLSFSNPVSPFSAASIGPLLDLYTNKDQKHLSRSAFQSSLPTHVPDSLLSPDSCVLNDLFYPCPPSVFLPSTFVYDIPATSMSYRDVRPIPYVPIYATKKYKPVALRTKPVLAELPKHFRIERHITGDPLAGLPNLPTHPPDFVPTGRYTSVRKGVIDANHPAGFLWPEERKLMHQFMCLHEGAFAWEDSERGHFKKEFFPPVEFPVVAHTPWVQRNIPIPPGIYDEVCRIIKSKMDTGIYEDSNSSYRSRWFCVVKKDGKSLRIVHSLEPLNKVTIRHSGVTPIPDHMAESFAGRACGGAFDIYVGYDEREIAEASRDLTTFQTPYGAKRLTTLPMGWTNSVPIFHDDVTYILRDEIPHVTIPYVDDVPCKGPKTRYELLPDDPSGLAYETIPENPGIRRFVWEHFENINRVVQRMRYAGGTFAGKKTYLCVEDFMAVGHRCTYHGRRPEEDRVAKVMKWAACQTLTDVRAFLGTVGVCRIFIKDFAKIARPLVDLTRKDAPFDWGPAQDTAMERLKQALLHSPALRPIDYESEAPVVLAVDTSKTAVGYILGQKDLDRPNVLYVNRFGSITLNERESRFSQSKLELYGLYRSQRALKMWLIGARNVEVRMDAGYIQGMLNNPDIAPSASMNRWITAILLFDFKLVHVPGATHGPDGLSRRAPQDDDEPEPEDDYDEWVDKMYGFVHMINPVPVQAIDPVAFAMSIEVPPSIADVLALRRSRRVAGFDPVQELDDLDEADEVDELDPPLADLPDNLRNWIRPEVEYDDVPRSAKAMVADSRVDFARLWLQDLRRPEGLSDVDFARNMRYAAQFFIRDGRLWRRHEHGAHKLVMASSRRIGIIRSAHDEAGHKGTWATKQHVMERFWWPFFGHDVAWWVRTCYLCQIRQLRHVVIPPTVALPAGLFSKLYADVMKLPKSGGFIAIVQGRCSISHFPEFAMLSRETAQTIGRWLLESILCRWGAIYEIVTDNGTPFIKAVRWLSEKYHINHIRISGYNSRANGIVERPHFDVRQALFKAADGDQSKWSSVAYSVFWADRITPRQRMGCSPYFAATGTHPIMPMDIYEATYLIPPPDTVWSTEVLIANRARQLQKRTEDLQRIHSAVYEARREAMAKFQEDHAKTIVDFNFKRGDLVLVRNTAIEKELNRKMKPRYYGPMVVISRNRGGAYILCELDGTMFHRPFAAFRLVPYFARRRIPLPAIAELVDTPRELPDLEDSYDDGRIAGEPVPMAHIEEVDDGESSA